MLAPLAKAWLSSALEVVSLWAEGAMQPRWRGLRPPSIVQYGLGQDTVAGRFWR